VVRGTTPGDHVMLVVIASHMYLVTHRIIAIPLAHSGKETTYVFIVVMRVCFLL
jgi:hypothetical protein